MNNISSNTLYSCGVCIVGSDTDLTQQFGRSTADHTFEIDYLPALGIDPCTKNMKVDNIQVNLKIIILHGDDNFHSIRKNQYRQFPICLFPFNKGKKGSFEKILHYYNEYKRAVINPRTIALVGIQSEDEEVTTEEGQQLADKLNAAYYETAINDKHQISQIFNELARNYLSSRSDTNLF